MLDFKSKMPNSRISPYTLIPIASLYLYTEIMAKDHYFEQRKKT